MSTQAASTTFVLDYVKTIGLVTNNLGRGFINPYDMTVTKDGRLLVLNRCDAARAGLVRVGIVSFEEDYLGEFGKGYGPGDGQLMLPVAMALDSRERVYITDEHTNKINVFDPSGDFLNKWGVSGGGDGELNGPSGIAIDSQDNIYISDQHNNRVQKFTASGEHIAQWGEAGSGPGQFNMPWGLTVDSSGDVYVADWRNDRIQKFSPEGRFLDSFGQSGDGDGQFYRPSGVAVDPEGYIYVSDWGNERVQVLDPDGSFRVDAQGPGYPVQVGPGLPVCQPGGEGNQGYGQSHSRPAPPSEVSPPYVIPDRTLFLGACVGEDGHEQRTALCHRVQPP